MHGWYQEEMQLAHCDCLSPSIGPSVIICAGPEPKWFCERRRRSGVLDFTSFASAAPLLSGCDIGPAIERLPPRRSCAADVMPRRRVIWAGDVCHRPFFGSTEGFEFRRSRRAKNCPFFTRHYASHTIFGQARRDGARKQHRRGVVSLSAVFVGYLRIWAGTNAVIGIVARRSLGRAP
jgi:hypothetical protein